MGVSDHVTAVVKLRARVSTVDPSQSLIEVVGADGAARRLALWSLSSTFRWPEVGEEYAIYEQNGYWLLGERFDLPGDPYPLSTLPTDTVRLDASEIRDRQDRSLVNTTDPRLAQHGRSAPFATQFLSGNQEAYHSNFGGTVSTQAMVDAVTPATITFTPPVDCWWEVEAFVGIVQKVDAAYNYIYAFVSLDKPDALGAQQAEALATQHSAVDTYLPRHPKRMFKLTGGVTYTAKLTFGGGDGGTWTYYRGPGQLWLSGKAWPLDGGFADYVGTTSQLDTWHPITSFLNGWAAMTATGFVSPAWKKDPFGRVYLRGHMAGGTISAPAFLLPPEARPSQYTRLSPFSSNASSTVASSLLYIEPGGSVYPYYGNNLEFSLDGMSFDTDSVSTFPAGPAGPQGPPGSSITIPMDTWHTIGAAGEPGFQSSWVNYDTANFASAGFRKDPFGRVLLRGLIKNGFTGTPPQAVFTLPPGYRPPFEVGFAPSHNASSTTINDVRVSPNGNVYVESGTNSFVFLDGIIFDTETVSTFGVGPKGDPGDLTSSFFRVAGYQGPFDGSAASNATINFPVGGEYIMIVQGSGYRTTGGVINLDFYIDGVLLAQSVGYTNEASSHKAMNTGVAVVNVIAGARSVNCRNGAPGGIPTSSDANDHASVIFIPTNQ